IEGRTSVTSAANLVWESAFGNGKFRFGSSCDLGILPARPSAVRRAQSTRSRAREQLNPRQFSGYCPDARMPIEKMLFDAYIIVDWSANSKPKLGKDSIWLAYHEHGTMLENVPTRSAARARVAQLLADAASRSRRVLVGF